MIPAPGLWLAPALAGAARGDRRSCPDGADGRAGRGGDVAVTGEPRWRSRSPTGMASSPALWMSLAAIGGGLCARADPRLRDRRLAAPARSRGQAHLRRAARASAPLARARHRAAARRLADPRLRGGGRSPCWPRASAPSSTGSHAAGTARRSPRWSRRSVVGCADPCRGDRRARRSCTATGLLALVLVGRRRADGLGHLRLSLRPRPCPDPDLGRGGDGHPVAARAEFPAQGDARRTAPRASGAMRPSPASRALAPAR